MVCFGIPLCVVELRGSRPSRKYRDRTQQVKTRHWDFLNLRLAVSNLVVCNVYALLRPLCTLLLTFALFCGHAFVSVATPANAHGDFFYFCKFWQ